MTTTPKVSVVVAAHNVAPFLSRCVESLVQQTETDVEILLIDDGSTDETPALVDLWAGRDSRIRAVHRPNGGLSEARNTGLRLTRGEFVCFLDGDDWAEPDLVASMVAGCERAAATVAVAGALVDFHDSADQITRTETRLLSGAVIDRGESSPRPLPDENTVNLLGYAWNKVYRREWLMDLGTQFEPGLSLIEDIVFNAQVLAVADRVALVPGAFVHYVQRPRLTLGSARDQSFLAKRMRAIDAVDGLLTAWNVGDRERAGRRSRACGLALWTAARDVIDGPRPRQLLRSMVDRPGADVLVRAAPAGLAAGWRTAWASSTIRRRLFGLALLPAWALGVLPRAAARGRALAVELRPSRR